MGANDNKPDTDNKTDIDYKFYFNIDDYVELMNKTCPKPNSQHRHLAIIFNRDYVQFSFYGVNNVKIRHGLAEHAEVNALRKLPPKFSGKDKNIDLLVLRMSETGVLGLSKPCAHCLKFMARMKGYNVKFVYYSDNAGNIMGDTFTHLYAERTQYFSKGYTYKKKAYDKKNINSSK